jgi:hypothetical protein
MTPATQRPPRHVSLLLAVLATLTLAPGAVASSQSVQPSPDTAALQFRSIRAGARLDELDTLVRSSGDRLHCDRAKADPHITECRALLHDPELGGQVSLWVSAIDSVAGVITLSSAVSADRLDRWRKMIERRYGRVHAQVQGTQWMMQWVRRGRMLRLTWRVDGGEKTASVSLVDGPVLDAWGRTRAKARRS